MKKIAILRCCVTPIFLRQYESSTNAVLKELGVELIDIEGFSCCGYPFKNINFEAHVLSSARNLALAEKNNLNIMTYCNCCYGTTHHANILMKENSDINKEMNAILIKEGLRYQGSINAKHLLHVLYKDIGIEKIRSKMTRTFKGLKIATHYGCHVLRPYKLFQGGESALDAMFDQLVALTDAENVMWASQRECCGAPIRGTNDPVSMDLLEKKEKDAILSDADCFCTACPYCQLQFDRAMRISASKQNTNNYIPSILYTQLIGLCLGIDKDVLGINKNELDMSGIMNFLS